MVLIVGMVFWFVVCYVSFMFVWIGVVLDLCEDVVVFFGVISWGVLVFICYFILCGLFEGLLLIWLLMFFSLGGLVLLVLLGYVFMYGKFGLLL